MKRVASVFVFAVLTACGGGGDDGGSAPPPLGGGNGGSQLPNPATAPALKTVIASRMGANFPIGAAIEPASTAGADAAILQRHFSSITAENVMKPDTIWPNAPGSTTQPAASPNFVPADQLVAFAAANNIQLRGHTLVWHATTPTWMVTGDLATIRGNLRTYITTVMQHFPNVYAWDVVNEAASDTPNPANPYRTNSPWYQAYEQAGGNGRDYVVDAFMIAGQVRAQMGKPNMRLILNDYNTELAGKRDNVLRIVDHIIAASAPIDGVGHQFHLSLGANVADVTTALAAVEGVVGGALVNHVTELDVSIYADPGNCFSTRTIPPCIADYGANPPQSVLSQQALLYRALFNAFNRPSVTSISLWGIADNHTWLNSFPVARTNRPLLFDTVGNPKWAFWTIVDPAITPP